MKTTFSGRTFRRWVGRLGDDLTRMAGQHVSIVKRGQSYVLRHSPDLPDELRRKVYAEFDAWFGTHGVADCVEHVFPISAE